MDEGVILRGLIDAVASWNIDECRSYAKLAMDSGMPPERAIEQGLAKGMECINDMFDAGTIYLPQILMASKAMEAALDIIEPHLKQDEDRRLKGIVVMGSVKGDIHSIGKNVCCAMLRGAGFKVIDLGVDVSPNDFAKAIEQNHANVVGGSALMTVSLPQQKDMVRTFKEDGYSDSGSSIVTLVRSLLAGDASHDNEGRGTSS